MGMGLFGHDPPHLHLAAKFKGYQDAKRSTEQKLQFILTIHFYGWHRQRHRKGVLDTYILCWYCILGGALPRTIYPGTQY